MGAPAVETWRWTASSFERAGEAGLFGYGTHADLIDGEVRLMSPQTPLHVYVLGVLDGARAELLPGHVSRLQSPVRLGPATEPEPDLYVATGSPERYAGRHPGPKDIELVVEVSVSSLGFDLGEKLQAYARHAVPLVWVVDVSHRQVLVYKSPEPVQAVYTSVETIMRGTLEAYGLEVEVERLWPPEP